MNTRRTTTILVVDDEPSIHSFLATLLQDKGHRVRSATSAEAAINCLHNADIDAIILDVKMPGRSGLHVLEHVRRHAHLRDVPVLIFTGASFTTEEEAVISTYRAYVFYKQEDPEEFVTYLDRVTRG